MQDFGTEQSIPCFAVLMPEMQQQLKSSKVSVPQNLAALMVSTHPTQVVNGVKREFLKPESTLHFIPRGRAVRGKGVKESSGGAPTLLHFSWLLFVDARLA